MELKKQTLGSLREMLDTKQISAAELCKEYSDSIKAKDSDVLGYITVTEDEALKNAEKAQEIIDKGEAKALTGIPLAIKDNICTDGIRTTCASKMLENFVPPYDANVIEKLKAENYVLLGKTSMDEFAMGGSTQTSAFAKTRNPFDLSRVPGGSSGGSAAVVSAGLAPAALGSDTGGSIRQPASFCGVTGLKPTYGRVSRYGLVAFASSLDQIGPIANSAVDCGTILNVICGKDSRDATSANKPAEDFNAKVGKDIKEMKIALPEEFFADSTDDDVKNAVLAAAKKYEEMGATLVDCSMKSLKYAVSAYYLVASAEAASNLSRFDGVKYGYRTKEYGDLHSMYKKTRSEGFGSEVKRRIMLGSFVLSSGYYDAYYLKALKTKALIKQEFDKAFEKYDIILAPAAPTTAPLLGSSLQDPIKMYLSDIYTISANLAGIPGLSIPCGKDKMGLPIGMQLLGGCFQEKTLLRAGFAYEKAREEEA